MKYFMVIFTAIVLCFGLAACGDDENDTAVVEDTAVDTEDAGSDAGEGEGEGSDAEASE